VHCYPDFSHLPQITSSYTYNAVACYANLKWCAVKNNNSHFMCEVLNNANPEEIEKNYVCVSKLVLNYARSSFNRA
jgi:hypothetical protein